MIGFIWYHFTSWKAVQYKSCWTVSLTIRQGNIRSKTQSACYEGIYEVYFFFMQILFSFWDAGGSKTCSSSVYIIGTSTPQNINIDVNRWHSNVTSDSPHSISSAPTGPSENHCIVDVGRQSARWLITIPFETLPLVIQPISNNWMSFIALMMEAVHTFETTSTRQHGAIT
jgi:hypothetical protein